jgi:hypothetical protein
MNRIVQRSKTTPRVKDGRVQRKNHRDVSWREPGPIEIRVCVPGPGYRHVVTREQLEHFVELIPDWSEISRGLDALVLAEGSTRVDGWYRDRELVLTAWPDPVEITVGAEYHAMHREIWERIGVPSRPAPKFISAVIGGDPDVCPEARDELDRWLSSSKFEIVRTNVEGEWVAIDRDEVPGTILAELTEIGHELHLYERCVFMRFDRCTAAIYQLLHVFLHELGHHVDAMTLPERGGGRGEDYAEQWANRCAARIWDDAVALLRR